MPPLDRSLRAPPLVAPSPSTVAGIPRQRNPAAGHPQIPALPPAAPNPNADAGIPYHRPQPPHCRTANRPPLPPATQGCVATATTTQPHPPVQATPPPPTALVPAVPPPTIALHPDGKRMEKGRDEDNVQEPKEERLARIRIRNNEDFERFGRFTFANINEEIGGPASQRKTKKKKSTAEKPIVEVTRVLRSQLTRDVEEMPCDNIQEHEGG
ncbi:hypothetical protein ZWY2020_021514 [Hordeum vulgare]|nr:hypothetical protein ZWY2020_021514 [Hordeum vulgare]